MLIGIDKIKVNERIRKDFGNIEELANDIRDNGLINPPVVTPDYELIAGERRLRALKHLGYNQIEVRVMTVNDALHQLKLEISENENRKDFSFNEKMTWAKMLEVEYGKIAKGNQATSTGGKTPQLCQNFAEAGFRTDSKVAEEVGFGNKETYRQAKYISDNASDDIIKSLDDGKLSINAAYRQLKEEKQKAENKIKELEGKNKEYELKTKRLIELEKEAEELQNELDNRPTITKTIEVKPNDYDLIKKNLSGTQQDYTNLRREYDNKIKEITDLKTQINTLKATSEEEQYNKKLKDSAIFFCARVNDFIEKTGGFAWLSDHVSELPEFEKQSYIKAVNVIESWVIAVKQNMINNNN